MISTLILAYGGRCICMEGYSGDYCQYKQMKLKERSINQLPQVEYNQFDTQALAVIANSQTSEIPLNNSLFEIFKIFFLSVDL